jgi:hypothetical protein
MALLTIAGITVPVAESGAIRAAPEEGASSNRTFNGNLRSTKRWSKRVWRVTTILMLSADAEAVENAVALGAQVACTGTVLGAANPTVTCEVEIADGAMPNGLSTDGLGFFRVLNLTLREV